MTVDAKPIGVIKKQFSGLVKELNTGSNNLIVKFPIDLSVRMKAALLGTVFLLVSTFF